MTLPSLHSAIQNGMNKKKLSFIGFDTCFGAELEVVYELCDCTEWFAGSAGVETASGWNYTDWLTECAASHTNGLEIAIGIEKQHSGKTASSFSIVDASKIPSLFTAFEAYAKVTAKKINTKLRQQKVHDAVLTGSTLYMAAGEASSLFVNIYDLSVKVTEKYTSLAPQATALQNAIKEAVCNTQSGTEPSYPLGVCFCMVDQTGKINSEFPSSYVHGSGETGQCLFVKDSVWYAPSSTMKGSLLDKIFFTTYEE